MYMMSKDPRSSQALAVLSPLARFHPTLAINLFFIAGDRNGTFQSRRGEEEVQGDLWELCAINHYGTDHKWLDFVVCLAKNYTDIPNNIHNCTIQADVDYALLMECVATVGPSLLRSSIADCLAIGLQAQSDSVIYINGREFNGPASPLAVEKALCSTENPIAGDNSVYQDWWFYFLIALGAFGGGAILIAGLLAAYRLYVKCGRASDMWLNMIKTNPGNALDFADKVQDAMHRFEKDNSYHDPPSSSSSSSGGGGGGYVSGSGGGRQSQRAMEEGQAYLYSSGAGAGSINSSSSLSSSSLSSSSLDGSPPRVQARYYEEESPLLAPPTYSTGWTMGGVRD
jgi:hypothetical protein